MSAVFVSLSDRRIAALIDECELRVAIAAPGIRPETAGALERACVRLGHAHVSVVVDWAEEVFRLGYGNLEALEQLRASGCAVRQSAGLRAGVLVCDDRAWAFAPTALYVEPEVHSDETPNAVVLERMSVHRLITALIGEDGTPSQHAPDELPGLVPPPGPEIGVEEVSEEEIRHTAAALKQAPPVPFDIARQVRVFQPYIQYVEIGLRGCAVQRHRLEIPKTVQGLDRNNEMSSRLRTTFELIRGKSEVSSKPLEDELNTIREDFTRHLGRPWGRVLLRAVRPVFDERIEEFRKRLETHTQAVKERLGALLEESRKELVDYFVPLAQRSLPDALIGQIIGPPTEDQVRGWLDAELASVFPEPQDLVSSMALDVQFRDVTYETLKEPGFADKLREAFPHVGWDKPFKEFDAARAREDAVPKAPATGD